MAFLLSIPIIILGMYACIHDASYDDEAFQTKKLTLTIDEAQRLFESEITRRKTRSGQEGLLTSGEITPDWSWVETSSNDRIACVDVPLNAQYGYLSGNIKTAHPSFTTGWI